MKISVKFYDMNDTQLEAEVEDIQEAVIMHKQFTLIRKELSEFYETEQREGEGDEKTRHITRLEEELKHLNAGGEIWNAPVPAPSVGRPRDW